MALILSSYSGQVRADAASKTISVAELQTIVAGLGLEDTGDKKTYVSIASQGKSGVTVNVFPTDDNTVALVYTSLGEIPKDKLALVPTEKMLEYNDLHGFFFSISGDDAKNINLEARLPAAVVSPQGLRKKIDALLEAVDETQSLWGADNWTAAAAGAPAKEPAKDYKTLQNDADAAWEAAPLELHHVLFTVDKVESYGDYAARDSSVFKTGEPLHIYVEPVNFLWRPQASGRYAFGVSADLLITTKAGDVIIDKKNAVTLAPEFPYKMKIVDVTFNVNLGPSLPATDYAVTVTVHDLNSPKVASASLPFSIVK